MKKAMLAFGLLLAAGCSNHQPLKTAEYVDLQRFMGHWYVVANIPTFIEKDAYNAVEIYQQNNDGSIATTFRFNRGSFEGKVIEYNPVAHIVDKNSNAIWEMQFIWPLKADYRILHINENYTVTVIGRNKRDHVWLMSRSPDISGEEYKTLMDIIAKEGYDIKKIQRIPHQSIQNKQLAWRT